MLAVLFKFYFLWQFLYIAFGYPLFELGSELGVKYGTVAYFGSACMLIAPLCSVAVPRQISGRSAVFSPSC